MAKYEVEVEGEVTESYWGVYDIEADSREEAEAEGRRRLEEDNYGVEAISAYAELNEEDDD